MKNDERMANQGNSDRLDRLTIRAISLLGSLLGLLIAASHLLASNEGMSSPHVAGSWSALGQNGGAAFLFLALAGTAGSALYARGQKKAAWIILFSGLSGFPVGYIAWMNYVGLLGWAAWLPSGVLLTAAGLLALITPERLRFKILGQDEEAADRKPIDQAIFVGSVLAGIGCLTVLFLVLGFLVFSAEDSLKDDASRDREDFENAELAASMGHWDKSVEAYDDILARNQSNIHAWEQRAYALEKLGKSQEAEQSREMAQQLDSQNRGLHEQNSSR